MSAPEKRPALVYPLLALGLVCFTSSAILIRFAADGPPMAVAVWRTVFAVLLLTPVALWRIRAEVRTFTHREVMLIGGAGVLLGLHFITFITSIYYTTVASASVLVSLTPVFLAILGFLLLKERLSFSTVVGIVLAVVGAITIGLGDSGGPALAASDMLLGNSLALTAALLFSFYLLIGRVVRQRHSWLAYVFPLYVVVAFTTVAGALALGTPLFGFSAGFYGLCLVMAIGPSIIGHGSFNYAVRYVSAALLGVLSLIEPVGASVVAYFLFDEVPGWIAVGGMLLVIIGVACALVPAHFFKRWVGVSAPASTE